ncbi:MAG: hypothetical protein GTN80_07045 [Nitrososphaeria archaeon]|nr:hypothetical protein [Nitrososphaeria archaeon]NIQ33382.1 hypothetical protein [Nitrososphaeria archaeon]
MCFKREFGSREKTNFMTFMEIKVATRPAMGPNMKHQTCPLCGTPIEKLSVGGGHTYFCSNCQI